MVSLRLEIIISSLPCVEFMNIWLTSSFLRNDLQNPFPTLKYKAHLKELVIIPVLASDLIVLCELKIYLIMEWTQASYFKEYAVLDGWFFSLKHITSWRVSRLLIDVNYVNVTKKNTLWWVLVPVSCASGIFTDPLYQEYNKVKIST